MELVGCGRKVVNSGGVVKKRAGYEYVILIILMAFSIFISVTIFAQRSQVKKANQLIDELSIMRKLVRAYKLEKKEFPKDLNSAIENAGTVDYFMLFRDESGEYIDPYNARYVYDPKKGSVSTTTKDHEDW